MHVQVLRVDYKNSRDAQALVSVLDSYARDPMGGGQPLSAYARENLPARLATLPHAVSFLAWQDGAAVGVLNAFEAFSSFKCKPILNIHDIAVRAECRGAGVGLALLQAAEQEALLRGCCKLTLEVLSGNKPAQRLYSKFGFSDYQLDPAQGTALFWEKPL